MNLASSSARSTPVISGTKKYVTRTPVTPQIAAMMNVHLQRVRSSRNGRTAGRIPNALFTQIVLYGSESLSANGCSSLSDGGG